MAEVVNQRLGAKPVGLEDEAGGAMRAETDGGANHAIPRRIRHLGAAPADARRELRFGGGLRRAA